MLFLFVFQHCFTVVDTPTSPAPTAEPPFDVQKFVTANMPIVIGVAAAVLLLFIGVPLTIILKRRSKINKRKALKAKVRGPSDEEAPSREMEMTNPIYNSVNPTFAIPDTGPGVDDDNEDEDIKNKRYSRKAKKSS